MATTRAKDNPRWVKSTSRPVMEVSERLIDGAATWKAGQFLTQKSDGLIYTCASDEDSIQYIALQDLDSAIGNDTTYMRLGVVHADDVFEMNVIGGSTNAAEAEVGTNYAMDVTSNVCTVDLADSGTAAKNCLKVVEPSFRNSTVQDKSTDVYGRVLVRVLQAAIDLLG
jgi:hypothetical protein